MKSLPYLVAPKWLIEPKDLKIKYKENMIVECKAEGEPRPSINWLDSKGL